MSFPLAGGAPSVADLATYRTYNNRKIADLRSGAIRGNNDDISDAFENPKARAENLEERDICMANVNIQKAL